MTSSLLQTLATLRRLQPRAPMRAATLLALSRAQADAGDWAGAFAASGEAVDIYRDWFHQQPDTFFRPLAVATHTHVRLQERSAAAVGRSFCDLALIEQLIVVARGACAETFLGLLRLHADLYWSIDEHLFALSSQQALVDHARRHGSPRARAEALLALAQLCEERCDTDAARAAAREALEGQGLGRLRREAERLAALQPLPPLDRVTLAARARRYQQRAAQIDRSGAAAHWQEALQGNLLWQAINLTKLERTAEARAVAAEGVAVLRAWGAATGFAAWEAAPLRLHLWAQWLHRLGLGLMAQWASSQAMRALLPQLRVRPWTLRALAAELLETHRQVGAATDSALGEQLRASWLSLPWDGEGYTLGTPS